VAFCATTGDSSERTSCTAARQSGHSVHVETGTLATQTNLFEEREISSGVVVYHVREQPLEDELDVGHEDARKAHDVRRRLVS